METGEFFLRVILVGSIGNALLEMLRGRHERQEPDWRGALERVLKRRVEMVAVRSKCGTSNTIMNLQRVWLSILGAEE